MSKYQRKVSDPGKLTDKALEDLYNSGFLLMGKSLEDVIEIYIMVNAPLENYTLGLSKLDQLPNYLKDPLLDKEKKILDAIQQLKKAISEPLSKKDKKTQEKRKHNAIGEEFLEGLF
jgi:hypothetical protein